MLYHLLHLIYVALLKFDVHLKPLLTQSFVAINVPLTELDPVYLVMPRWQSSLQVLEAVLEGIRDARSNRKI